MRKHPLPAAIAAAALAREARRQAGAAIPLYLPAFDRRFETMPEGGDADEQEVDASGVTVGGEEDDGYL